jgi:hypothetical protein
MYLQCLRQRRDVTTRLPLSENDNISLKFELLKVLNTVTLDIHFGTDLEYEEHEFNAFHDVEQSPIRVIDLFQSLMFDWVDV